MLTLSEALKTFEVESNMFNIKLYQAEGQQDFVKYRTVILTKNMVEVEGKNELIIMIRDVTDKVSLEKEQIKKKK